MSNQPEELDDFHWHEAIDRTHVVMCMFSDHVATHPVVEQTEVLKEMAERIERGLMDLYQRIGHLIDGDEPEAAG